MNSIGHNASLDPRVRKSEILRLLDEYIHMSEGITKTTLKAFKYDVERDLPTVPLQISPAAKNCSACFNYNPTTSQCTHRCVIIESPHQQGCTAWR